MLRGMLGGVKGEKSENPKGKGKLGNGKKGCYSYHALYDDNACHMFDYIFIVSAIRSAVYNKCVQLYNMQVPSAIKW